MNKDFADDDGVTSNNFANAQITRLPIHFNISWLVHVSSCSLCILVSGIQRLEVGSVSRFDQLYSAPSCYSQPPFLFPYEYNTSNVNNRYKEGIHCEYDV